MNHLTDEQLTLLYYGEPGGTDHLAQCAECRSRMEELRRTLSLIALPEAPPRPADYGSHVWATIKPRLAEAEPSRAWWQMPRAWGVAAAAAVLIAGGFFAGRFSAPRSSAPVHAHGSQGDRLLLVALSGHLERSEMLLVEVAHASSPEDLAAGRTLANDLIASNRLYRQAAQRSGDASTQAVLDDLERVLVELAHESSTETGLQQVRHQVESGSLLFKVRVAEFTLKSEAAKPSYQNSSAMKAMKRPAI